jgi:hypothetical protein
VDRCAGHELASPFTPLRKQTLEPCLDRFASNGRQDLVFALPISLCTSVAGSGSLLVGGGGDEQSGDNRSRLCALRLDRHFHQAALDNINGWVRNLWSCA